MNLIFVPFAYLNKFKSSENIKHNTNTVQLYLKNVYVALSSLKLHNIADVAFVTNCSLDIKYTNLFNQNGIKIINCSFDSFKFPSSYPWSLSYYKFCALEYVINNFNYSNYIMLDSDVYAMHDLSNVFDNLDQKIFFYNHGGTIQLKNSYKELNINLKLDSFIKRVGGEFLACNRSNASNFIKLSKEVFNIMIKDNIVVNYGDEYITSIVANLINNAYFVDDSLIARCWTGTYRHIPKNINNSAILHVPSEKQYGMLKLYKYIIKYGKLPTNDYVIKKLHIDKISFNCKIKKNIKKILQKKI